MSRSRGEAEIREENHIEGEKGQESSKHHLQRQRRSRLFFLVKLFELVGRLEFGEDGKVVEKIRVVSGKVNLCFYSGSYFRGLNF